MRLRHGAFSYLPDLTDEEIAGQVRYALLRGWPVSIEYTDDPHPRNVYWEMWGLPMFDLAEPDGVMAQINACRATFPESYVRVQAYDARLGRQSIGLHFLVQRPAQEKALALVRAENHDRTQRYGVQVVGSPAESGP